MPRKFALDCPAARTRTGSFAMLPTFAPPEIRAIPLRQRSGARLQDLQGVDPAPHDQTQNRPVAHVKPDPRPVRTVGDDPTFRLIKRLCQQARRQVPSMRMLT